MIDLKNCVGEFFYLLRYDCSNSLKIKLLFFRVFLAFLKITRKLRGISKFPDTVLQFILSGTYPENFTQFRQRFLGKQTRRSDEVREILLSRKGLKTTNHSQCLFPPTNYICPIICVVVRNVNSYKQTASLFTKCTCVTSSQLVAISTQCLCNLFFSSLERNAIE